MSGGRKCLPKNGLLLSSLMSSWQIWPFIFCSMAEANQGGWAQPQDPPASCARGAIPTAAVLFRKVGLLFVKRRGPRQMLCSTSRLDPDALMFQRWRSLGWEICTAHPLSRLDRLVPGRSKSATPAPPPERHWFLLPLGSPNFTCPSAKSASSRRNCLLAPAYA